MKVKLYIDDKVVELDLGNAHTQEDVCEEAFVVLNRGTAQRYGSRSLSVGDLAIFEDGTAYRCEPVGWKRLNPEQKAWCLARLGQRGYRFEHWGWMDDAPED